MAVKYAILLPAVASPLAFMVILLYVPMLVFTVAKVKPIIPLVVIGEPVTVRSDEETPTLVTLPPLETISCHARPEGLKLLPTKE